MERKYSVYKITSPSGKCYIGLTKMDVKSRWYAHVRKSRTGYNHPFYCALRKYGSSTFVVETLFSGLTGEEACLKEVEIIASVPAKLKYNVSSGGENDGREGGVIFWAKVNSDPAYKAKYLKKLAEGVKNGKAHDYKHISAMALQWRKDNPKEAWKLAWRGIRLANKANAIKFKGVVKTAPSPYKQRLLYKYKKSKMSKINTTKMWEKRTEEQKKILSTKISNTLKEKNKNLSPEQKMAMVSKARTCIDRSVQGPAASKGIKAFWVELKKDPVKFREHMDKKTAKMMKTRNAAKK